ncbi:MAG: nuclear transport factor 2 family protein [Acidimicrobiales bacterium]
MAGPFVDAYVDMISKLFAGDLTGAGAHLTEDCVWSAPAGEVLGREAVIAAADAGRAAGWASHTVVESAEAGGVLALVAENTYADGRRTHVAAAVEFDSEGLMRVLKGVGPGGA